MYYTYAKSTQRPASQSKGRMPAPRLRCGTVKRLPHTSLSSAILAALLLFSVSVALAGQVMVVPTETEVQKAGTILTVSSRFLATNRGEDPVMGVMVFAANGSGVSIGDIPPHGEVMSPPLIFALDLGGFDGRNLAFPITVQFYAGEALQSVPASFFCEIPQ